MFQCRRRGICNFLLRLRCRRNCCRKTQSNCQSLVKLVVNDFIKFSASLKFKFCIILLFRHALRQKELPFIALPLPLQQNLKNNVMILIEKI